MTAVLLPAPAEIALPGIALPEVGLAEAARAALTAPAPALVPVPLPALTPAGAALRTAPRQLRPAPELPTPRGLPTPGVSEPPRAFRVRPAPRREPPFDDELPAATLARPYDRPLPLPRGQEPAGPVSERQPELPDPERWSRAMLIGMIEAAAGQRPVAQLRPMLSTAVADGLLRALERAEARGQRHWTHTAVVRSVRATRTAATTAEVCATLQHGPRVRAAALRLEARRGQWRCAILHLG